MSINEYASVLDAIEGLKRRGYTADFEFSDDAVQDTRRRKRYKATELAIIEHHRFEGQSDPDDMAIVYALKAADGTRGVLADAFGTYADPGLGAFLKDVENREAH